MKTYVTVEKEIAKAFTNGIRNITSIDILNWYSEYSEWNHIKMLTIQEILSECSSENMDEMRGYLSVVHHVDELSEECKKLKKKLFHIRNIGLEIHNRGGFAAMQANFYIFFNFLIPRNDVEEMIKFRNLKYLWHGIGNWKE